MSAGTTESGYISRNRQITVRDTGLPGTDRQPR